MISIRVFAFDLQRPTRESRSGDSLLYLNSGISGHKLVEFNSGEIKYVTGVIFLVLSFIIRDGNAGCSAAVARFVRDEEVASSILATPTSVLIAASSATIREFQLL